jgi:hypothetical protein
MDFLTPHEVSALLARLNGLITDAQRLQIDIQQKAVERRAFDQSVSQPLGARRSTDRAERSDERLGQERRRNVDPPHGTP